MFNWSRIAWKGAKAFGKAQVNMNVVTHSGAQVLNGRGSSGGGGGGSVLDVVVEYAEFRSGVKDGDRAMAIAKDTEHAWWFRTWAEWGEQNPRIGPRSPRWARKVSADMTTWRRRHNVVRATATRESVARHIANGEAVVGSARRFLAWWAEVPADVEADFLAFYERAHARDWS